MSINGSKIQYKKLTDSTKINGKPIYMYWVEPSLPIELPFKIEIIRKRESWYKRVAKKKWINEQLFEWAEMNCAGHYALFGDTNELYLTENGKELFRSSRENFNHLDSFSVTNIDTGQKYYFTDDSFDNLGRQNNVSLN